MACINQRHDHLSTIDRDGMDVDPHPMICMDCGVPTHYDMDAEDYVHDDPAAAACFLVQRRPTNATLCVSV